MIRQYDPAGQCEFIVAPLGESGVLPLHSIGEALAHEGMDVRFDDRKISFEERRQSWIASGARAAILADDGAIANGNVSIFTLADDIEGINNLPPRRVMNYLLQKAGLGNVPAKTILPWEAATAPAPKKEAPAPAPEAEAPAAPKIDPAIPSWDLEDRSWMREIGTVGFTRIQKVKAEWKFPKACRFAVRRGDRIYKNAKAASLAHREFYANGEAHNRFSIAIKKGMTALDGDIIGFADPELEAIRMGKSREEYRAEAGLKAAPPIATIRSTQGSVIDAPPVKAAQAEVKKAARPDPAPAPAGEEIAMIVTQEDGTLGFDRDFTAEQAARVIEFCKAVAAKSARVSL